MTMPFDTKAPKKPTIVCINSDLLSKAKDLKINLSTTLENALAELANKKQREPWKEQNKASIEGYNQFVEDNGVFDSMRDF